MAFDAFLKIDGIPGGSLDKAHPDQIEILSFQFGATQTKGRQADLQEFTITKFLDKSSPLIFAALCRNESIPTAVFTARKAGEGQPDFYKVTMRDVIIASVTPGGSTGAHGTLPFETVALSFGQAAITFTPQNNDGSAGTPVTATCSAR